MDLIHKDEIPAVNKNEIESQLNKLRNGKATGPLAIVVEVFEEFRDAFKSWLLESILKITQKLKIPEEWD